MKKLLVCAAAMTTIMSVNAQVKTTKAPVKPTTKVTATSTSTTFKTAEDSLSYAIGMSVGESMQQAGVPKVNPQLFAKAIGDIYDKKTTAFTPDASGKIIQQKMGEYAKVKTDAMKEDGVNFLELNKKRSNIKSTASGIQYEILKPGINPDAPMPKAVDTVVVNYIGTLINGTEFDNSVKRGEPATFPLNGVIRGWTEILQLMRIGDHWKVYIPSELAYGENPPQGSGIAPYSVLIFEITLENIKPAVAVTK